MRNPGHSRCLGARVGPLSEIDRAFVFVVGHRILIPTVPLSKPRTKNGGYWAYLFFCGGEQASRASRFFLIVTDFGGKVILIAIGSFGGLKSEK